METKLLIISIILIVIGLILIGIAWSLANHIILPNGGANWKAMEIAILVGGILFLVIGIGLFIYSFYVTSAPYVPSYQFATEVISEPPVYQVRARTI